jgi:hypothetical protein
MSVPGCGEAQAPDPVTLLADATTALGAEDLSTIQYTGNGWDSPVGHAWSVQESWARWSLTGYDRVIDYAATSSRHSAQRQAGMDPDRLGGFGAQPGANPQTQTSNITANSPWDQRLVVYFTPYGFLRLAEGREATVEARTVDGIRYNVLSFSVEDGEETRQLEGYFDTDDVLRKIETRLDDPVMGDMRVEVEFDDYQDVNGVLFPMHVLESRGELAYKELTIDSVVPNAVIEEPEQAAGGGGRGGGGRGAGDGGRPHRGRKTRSHIAAVVDGGLSWLGHFPCKIPVRLSRVRIAHSVHLAVARNRIDRRRH